MAMAVIKPCGGEGHKEATEVSTLTRMEPRCSCFVQHLMPAGTEIGGADANYPDVFEQTLLPVMAQQPQWWPEPRRCLLSPLLVVHPDELRRTRCASCNRHILVHRRVLPSAACAP